MEITPLSILKESINYKDIVQVFPHQEEVLNKYYDKFQNEKFLGIELPTGSGKTFIFLAIAEYWRRKGKKVCVLAQNKQLTEQLKKEADKLKLKAVIIHKKNDNSQESQANLRKYNFKDSFGIANYFCFIKHQIEADMVIFDDCHLLEDTLRGEFSLKFSYESEDYNAIKEFLIKKGISSEEEIKDISKKDSIKLLDFIYEQKIIDFIEKNILSGADEENENYWKYYYNKEYLKNFLFFITREGFFLTPFATPLNCLTQFENVKQKIFLSATIPSKNQFIFSIGLEEQCEILRYQSLDDCDYNKLTIGQRLILPFPNFIDKSLEEPIEEYHHRLSNHLSTIVNKFGKVLVLCRSLKELEVYKEKLSEKLKDISIFTPTDSDFYENFKNENNSILLLANRYSGLDFPGDVCNVVVLTTIPEKCAPVESFIKEELNDNPYSQEKTAMRIIQSFGRCNRNKKDIGIYFVLPAEFYYDFNKQTTFSKYYPSNIINEIIQGIEIYENDSKKDMEILATIGKTFIENPQIFEVRKKEKEVKLPDDSKHYNKNIVKSWGFMLKGNYKDSRDILQYVIKKEMLSDNYKCWFYYLMARCEFYLRGEKPTQDVVNLLENAIRRHKSPFFNKLNSHFLDLKKSVSGDSEEYRFFSENVRKKLKDMPKTLTKLLEIKQGLESTEHNKICSSVNSLLNFFGINSKDISKENMSSCDLIVKDIILNKGYLIEVKSKSESNIISSKDVAQLKKHTGGEISQDFRETKYILLTKDIPLEKGVDDQLEGINLSHIEDYISLINSLLINSTNIEKFLEEILKFYETNFSNL